MQPAKVGDAGGGAHAAEEAVAFHHQGLAPERARGRGGRDARRSAAEHDHVVFAAHGKHPFRFADGFCSHRSMIALQLHRRTRPRCGPAALRPVRPCPTAVAGVRSA
jgi:hypothetical protein